jgi:peroxin-14
MDRNKDAQNLQLQDLQNELKSLKSLLLNRTSQRSFTPTAGGAIPSSASAPGLNTALSNTNGTAAPTTTEALNAAALSGRSETPPPSGSGTSSTFVPSRPGIPAWQLAAREKAQQSSKAEEEKDGALSTAG